MLVLLFNLGLTWYEFSSYVFFAVRPSISPTTAVPTTVTAPSTTATVIAGIALSTYSNIICTESE